MRFRICKTDTCNTTRASSRSARWSVTKRRNGWRGTAGYAPSAIGCRWGGFMVSADPTGAPTLAPEVDIAEERINVAEDPAWSAMPVASGAPPSPPPAPAPAPAALVLIQAAAPAATALLVATWLCPPPPPSPPSCPFDAAPAISLSAFAASSSLRLAIAERAYDGYTRSRGDRGGVP